MRTITQITIINILRIIQIIVYLHNINQCSYLKKLKIYYKLSTIRSMHQYSNNHSLKSYYLPKISHQANQHNYFLFSQKNIIQLCLFLFVNSIAFQEISVLLTEFTLKEMIKQNGHKKKINFQLRMQVSQLDGKVNKLLNYVKDIYNPKENDRYFIYILYD